MTKPDSGLPLSALTLLRAACALIVALVLISVLVAANGMSLAALQAAMVRLPVAALLPIAIAQVLMVILAGWKWQRMLYDLSGGRDRIPLGSAVAATTAGTLAGQILPIQIVTPAARTLWARRANIPVAHALGSSIFEQAFDLLALTGFVLALGIAWVFGAGLFSTSLMVLTVALALIFSIRPLLSLASHVFGYFLPVLARGMALASKLTLASLSAQMGVSLLRLAIVAGLNVGTLVLLLPGTDPVPLLLVLPLLQLASALPIVPAGLGLVEAGWAGVLITGGADAASATAAALALRIITTGAFIAVSPLLLLAGSLRGRT